MPPATPSFWYKKSVGWQAALLAPAALAYGMGRSLHRGLVRAHELALPTICIGNITTGGSGKTPTARALMKLIRTEQLADTPMFVTRGYGGTVKGPALVDTAFHTFRDIGDEALLLAQDRPTIVAARRPAGVETAKKQNADLVIMDDGFQNPHIRAALNIVVIDGGAGFGNRCLLPAGPLREGVRAATARADAFILIGDDAHNIRKKLPADKPCFAARIEPAAYWVADHERRYVGFAGLGRPEKFRRTLTDLDLRIKDFHAFPDHHAYTDADMQRLRDSAARHEARLITTEKDLMRLPLSFRQHTPPDILPIELSFTDREALTAFLRQRLAP